MPDRIKFLDDAGQPWSFANLVPLTEEEAAEMGFPFSDGITITPTMKRAVSHLPPPPSDEELQRHRAMGAPSDGTLPHHWEQGPTGLHHLLIPRRVKLRDGTTAKVNWEKRWFLERVTGTDPAKALTRLYDVFLSPAGWVRAGVRWKRVGSAADADILVRVIPMDTTVCGKGSSGCFSWGSGTPLTEVGVELIDRDGPWRVVVGMECQGHGTFSTHDGYINHPGYEGVMGSWESTARFGYSPSNAEIASAKEWLEGKVPADRIHEH